MIKKLFAKVVLFVKKNLISCICLLLSATIALTGGVSYSKYASGSGMYDSPNAGSFHCSANIFDAGALSFTNTAFWGGEKTDNEKIAMNALRAIDFDVYNYDHKVANSKPSDVKMAYDLVFTAPQNFVERLAIQLFDNNKKPLGPQIVVQDMLASIPKNATSGTFDTARSDDYHGEKTTPIVFDVERTAQGTFIATSQNLNISFEPVSVLTQQTLCFRLWDTSKLTNNEIKTVTTEGGKLLPPLEVKYTTQALCYKITISMPDFVMDAGVKLAERYTLRLVPTSVIQDLQLGAYFMEHDQDGNLILSQSLFGDLGDAERKVWTTEVLQEDYTDIYHYPDGTVSEPLNYTHNVLGSIKIYNTDEVITNIRTTLTREEVYSDPVVTPVSNTTRTVIATNYNNTVSASNFRTIFGGPFEEVATAWSTTSNSTNTRTRTLTLKYNVGRHDEVVTTTDVTTVQQDVVTTIDTDFVDTIKVDYVNDVTGVVKQTITEEEIIDKVVSTTTTTSVQTSTHTVQEKYQGERTVVILHTQTKRSSQRWTNIGDTGGTNTYTIQDQGIDTVYWYPEFEIEREEIYTGHPVITSDSHKDRTTETLTTTIDRTIQRIYRESTLTIDSVSRKMPKVDGDDELEGEEIFYTKDNPFRTLDVNGVQQYFISQSYSKSYPLSVNVIFKQILE